MSDLIYRRLRAPSENGAALVEPPLQDAPSLVARNQLLALDFDRQAGLPSGFRAEARSELWQTWPLNEAFPARPQEFSRPLILAGHQPELFHPGVWFKNFVLSAAAQIVAGDAVNLIIDNDIVRSPSIRVPSSVDSLSSVVVEPFDDAGGAVPWEERNILNQDTFRDFANQVNLAFRPFRRGSAYGRGMLLDRLWPHALKTIDSLLEENRASWESITARIGATEFMPFEPARCDINLGWTLSRARHMLERDLGLCTNEINIGRLGFTQSFLTFTGSLLSRIQELHAVHNAALAEYRLVNNIKSRSHPVPDLVRYGEWLEAPFWVWTISNPHRRRVFVRPLENTWELTDREGFHYRAPVGDPAQSIPVRSLIHEEFRIRPRALITTMYARLVLSDLFIHGIGGAKYDELTDAIIRRFFGIEPPAYVTATSTFRLPIERPQVTVEDVRDAARRVRDVRYRPESLLDDPRVTSDAALSENLAAYTAEKREFLMRHDLRRCSQDVFDKLDALNRAMHELLRPLERELRAEQAELAVQLKQAQLLGSREFSFVLFPSEILPARLLDLCKLPT